MSEQLEQMREWAMRQKKHAQAMLDNPDSPSSKDYRRGWIAACDAIFDRADPLDVLHFTPWTNPLRVALDEQEPREWTLVGPPDHTYDDDGNLIGAGTPSVTLLLHADGSVTWKP
jgi:hypothetical protein